MHDDLELLRRFARDGEEESFAELVRRHLNLVHSAALRQVRSPQLAEEVAQSVFTDLARDAGRLKPGTVLAAWLYQVTRRTAIDVVRREARRQLREQVALEMNAMNSTSSDWVQVEPLLDDAMAALDDTDRTAVLLRYFENKSLRDVGAALGTSDDTAQKRVSRAVDKLRDFFAQRGVIVGASALSVAVSTNAVQAAPVALAATISASAALAGTTFVTATGTSASNAIAMTTLQKALAIVVLAAAVGAGVYEAQQANDLRSRVHALHQQQEPLKEQIQQLQQQRDKVMGQFAAVQREAEQLRRDAAEIHRLRAEVTRLNTGEKSKGAMSPAIYGPTAELANAWAGKVNQLRDYLKRNPGEVIPEMTFLSERSWLSSIDPTSSAWALATEKDYQSAMSVLRNQAVMHFEHLIENALREYFKATEKAFPTDITQLQPYCDPPVANVLIQLYEMAPASGVPQSQLPRDERIDGDFVIARKTSQGPRWPKMYVVPLKRAGFPVYQMTFF